jgi:hypothetical protein
MRAATIKEEPSTLEGNKSRKIIIELELDKQETVEHALHTLHTIMVMANKGKSHKRSAKYYKIEQEVSKVIASPDSHTDLQVKVAKHIVCQFEKELPKQSSS